MGLDVLDDQFAAARVAHVWRLVRKVPRVAQVPHQHHVEAQPRHHADSEGAVEDTLVGVDARDGEIGDAFLLTVVVDFLAVFTDAVITGYIDGRVLALPGNVVSRSRRFGTCKKSFRDVIAADAAKQRVGVLRGCTDRDG